MNAKIFLTAVLIFSSTGNTSPAKHRWSNHKELHSEVKQLVLNKNWDKLHALGESILKGRDRFPLGTMALEEFYNGIGYAHNSTTDIHVSMQEWQEAMPQSHFPRVASARAFRARAWEVRGNEFVDKLSAATISEFKKHLLASKAASEESLKMTNKDPESFTNLIEVLYLLQTPISEIDKFVEKAIAAEPAYLPLYRVCYNYSQPKWLGTKTKMKQVLELAAKSSRKTDGDTFYGRLAYIATHDSNEIFSDGTFSWPRTQKSFEEGLKLWPDSKVLPIQFWYVAAIAKDKKALKKLNEKIGRTWDPTKEYYIRNKDWFLSMVKWADEPSD